MKKIGRTKKQMAIKEMSSLERVGVVLALFGLSAIVIIAGRNLVADYFQHTVKTPASVSPTVSSPTEMPEITDTPEVTDVGLLPEKIPK